MIVTGDRDSYQLVHDPLIRVLYNRRGVSDYALYDEAGIAEKTGVTPTLYPQYAALRFPMPCTVAEARACLDKNEIALPHVLAGTRREFEKMGKVWTEPVTG